MMKIDDPSMSAHVHGFMAMYSLFSICFFHKTEGFFFRDIYLTYMGEDSKEIAPIILVLGSNSLSCFFVVILTFAITFISIRVLMKPFMRVSKV